MRTIMCIICMAICCGISFAEDVAKQQLYDVILLSYGDRERQAIDVVCKLTGRNFDEVKKQFSISVKLVSQGLKKVDGEKAVRALESAGCKAELRPSGKYSFAEIFAVEIVRRVKWPGNHPKDEYWVFCNTDDVELKRVWKEDDGKQDELPAIDHSKESLVVFFKDPKDTHGHQIKIEKACHAADAEGHRLIVLYRETCEELSTQLAGDAIVVSPDVCGRDFHFSAYDLNSEKSKEFTQLRDWYSGSKEKKEDK